MYLEHFRLSKPPFSLTPDPDFLFLGRDHRDALAHLLYGIRDSVGFVQLTGEVGTGKTTLCRYLLARSPDRVDVALILNPRQTAVELLASVCDELRIPYPSPATSGKDLVDRLNRSLLDRHRRGRRTVLVVDEAQNLSPDVLEQIRLLTNLETPTAKLLQILLIGQPELRGMMRRPDLRQLDQRIIARYHLDPLSEEETVAYVRHRLKVAGAREGLFTDGALRRVYRLSRGIPRLVNVLCDRCLLGAYARGRDRVDAAMVRAAHRDVRGERSPAGRRRWFRPAAVLGLAAVAGGAAVLLVAKVPVRHPGPAAPPAVEEPAADPGPPPPAATAEPDAMRVGPQSARAPADRPTERPPVPAFRPEPPAEDDLGGWLSADGVPTDEETAFATLLTYWNVDVGSFPDPPGCRLASAAGLRCLEVAGSTENLAAFNRAAVLQLEDGDGGLRHAVLAEITPAGMVLDVAGRRRAFGAREVADHWTGRFTLMWRPPPLEEERLQKGLTGPDVLWLRRQLNRVEGLPPEPDWRLGDPAFDGELEERVKAFQTIRGIPVDGVVGVRTLLELDTATAGPTVPLLRDPAAGDGKD